MEIAIVVTIIVGYRLVGCPLIPIDCDFDLSRSDEPIIQLSFKVNLSENLFFHPFDWINFWNLSQHPNTNDNDNNKSRRLPRQYVLASGGETQQSQSTTTTTTNLTAYRDMSWRLAVRHDNRNQHGMCS